MTGKDEADQRFKDISPGLYWLGKVKPPILLPVKMMEGNYLYADLGKDIGNISGLECTIYSQGGNVPIAIGYVTFVNETECTIEIQNFLIDQNVSVGDVVELNVAQWQQDF